MLLISRDVKLKKAAQTHGGEWAGSCPFCKDGTDRFRVWPNMMPKPKWWCRICNKSGDAIDYVMQRQGVSFKKALDLLGMDDLRPVETEVKQTLPPTASDLSEVIIDTSLVDCMYKDGIIQAAMYFEPFGIGFDAACMFNLGYYRAGFYNGYTIPHYWTRADGSQIVKGVKIRQAAADADPRYVQLKTSKTFGIFNDRWTSNPDNSRIGPAIPFCIVNEDEKSTMLLDQFYPAVGYQEEHHWDKFLPVVFQNVGTVIRIAHNDEPDKKGKRPGIDKALHFVSCLPGRHTMILMHPHHKDLCDFAKAEGVDAVRAWLEGRVPGLKGMERMNA